MSPIDHNEWAALREDVGYIKRSVETFTEELRDHEGRIRSLEEQSSSTFTGMVRKAAPFVGPFAFVLSVVGFLHHP